MFYTCTDCGGNINLGDQWKRYKITIVEFDFVIYTQGIKSKLRKDFQRRAPGCKIIIEECEGVVRI